MEVAAIGMAIVDLDGRFVEVNDALCRIVARPADVLTTLTFHGITHPDDLDADVELAAQLASGAIDHYDLEKRYLRPDGSEVYVLLTGSVIRNADGTPRHYIAQVQDISRRKAAEAQLALTLGELRQSNATLSEFAAVVAHDLKTPLASAMGLGEVIAMRFAPSLPEQARELLARSSTQLRRLSTQVDGLLRLASISQRAMQLDDVVLDEAIRASAPCWARPSPAPRSTSEAPDAVRVDAAALDVLLQNLLDERGEPRRIAHPGAQSPEADDWVRVEVDDDGQGIPLEDREGVFDLFARSTTQAPGTGVGLALCRRVVERHGGAIGIDDSPLGGARVWFTLPTGRATDDLGVDGVA